MDIPSLRGLRSGLEVLRQLEIMPESRHVVLNMADAKAGHGVASFAALHGVSLGFFGVKGLAVMALAWISQRRTF